MEATARYAILHRRSANERTRRARLHQRCGGRTRVGSISPDDHVHRSALPFRISRHEASGSEVGSMNRSKWVCAGIVTSLAVSGWVGQALGQSDLPVNQTTSYKGEEYLLIG